MVSNPTTINFDLSRVTYFKDKGTQIDQAKAQAVDQLSHAEMVKDLTGFIDALIELKVDKLEAVAKDTDNPKAQKAAESLDKYKEDRTVTSFKGEVADELAKNIYAVQHLLIQDNLANPNGQEMTFRKKGDVLGSHIVSDSAKELTEQTLASIHTKLSAYGIKVNAKEAAQLKQVIIEELKKPPKPKSEVDITASAAAEAASTAATTETTDTTATPEKTPPENPNNSTIDSFKEEYSKLAKGLLKCESVITFLNQPADSKTGQASGISQLRELNERIKQEVSGWNNLDEAGPALKSFQDNLAENVKFIADHLRKETFISAFETLDNNKKIQVGILLKNLETTVDEKIMVGLTGKITGQLGNGVKQNLQTELSNLIENHNNSNTPNTLFTLNLSKANEHLEKYNQALKDIKSKNLSTQQEIQEKQKATAHFLESIKEGLGNRQLSPEDVKVIQKSLELTEEKRKSGKASPAIDNILGNFIDTLKEKGKELGLNITEESLKQFAGSAVVLAIGATLFCPNLIGNLAKGAFSLGTMMTQTVIPLYERHAQNNMMKALAQNKQNSH
jgi:hypothetical protein